MINSDYNNIGMLPSRPSSPERLGEGESLLEQLARGLKYYEPPAYPGPPSPPSYEASSTPLADLPPLDDSEPASGTYLTLPLATEPTAHQSISIPSSFEFSALPPLPSLFDVSSTPPFHVLSSAPDAEVHKTSALLNELDESKFLSNSADKSFKVEKKLNSHVKRHKVKRPLQCTQCDKQFSKGFNLTVHVRMHTGERPYKCDQCEYAAAHQSHLKSHKRSHTGEKPFACNYCNFATAYSSVLISHKRTHTGAKPYECDHCDFRAVKKSVFTIHTRTHKRK